MLQSTRGVLGATRNAALIAATAEWLEMLMYGEVFYEQNDAWGNRRLVTHEEMKEIRCLNTDASRRP